MKLIAYVLTFCLTANVFAASTPSQELERTFDNYQYALTVDWDQKDKAFLDQRSKEFSQEIAQLINKGLTKEELEILAEKKMGNKQAIETMKAKLVLSTANSPEEIAQIMRESSKDFYAQGASWNGQNLVQTGLIILVLGILASALYHTIFLKCVEWRETDEIECFEDTTTVCSGLDGCRTIYLGSVTCDNKQVCENYEKK